MEMIIHHGMAILLCLVGFHGVFFYGNLAKKTVAWALFQIGLIVFLYQLISSGAPLPSVLAIEVTSVTLVVTVLLGIFCVKLNRRHKTLEGAEIAKRGPK